MPYFFAPIDKAGNIIWKRYYVEVLKYELNSTGTYEIAPFTKINLFKEHITKHNIKIEKCDLPTFSWLPHMTKLHCESCFIVSPAKHSDT